MSEHEFDRPAPSLSGRTIFITGANGFIGRAMAARFRALGAVVRGVDLAADPAGDVVAGDITRPETWAAGPTGLEGADTVIHTAALLGAAFPLKQAWHVNVLGTSRVLRAAIDAGVRRFVHFSSVAAYGFEFPDGADETYPVHVNGDVYTDTKVNSEAVVLAAHGAGEIDVTVIRPGDVWGPGSVWVRSPIAEMRKRTGFPLPNGGNGIFSPVYIDNFVDGMVLAVSSDDAVGQVFNITDGKGVRCADFFGRMARMSDGTIHTLPIRVAAPAAELLGSLLRRLGQKTDLSAGTMWLLNRPGTYSIEKAQKMLGYQPRVSIEEGMARVQEWARAERLI
ncbi:NAD-dependent epimerase/dehydratase family protein [Mycobacterium marinum]|uniref:NAD-dependent epimerase/dehydratase family protein n=1 Tax=Mycobacterium marinum TaxID=1781 RepID=UPI001922C23D|nr:NAD(P)-dependent oxidoreductase [Mycobacterium marinum]QQW36291.1 NAD(P)-dependent oxidoreductase [Mycobacterium marinum]